MALNFAALTLPPQLACCLRLQGTAEVEGLSGCTLARGPCPWPVGCGGGGGPGFPPCVVSPLPRPRRVTALSLRGEVLPVLER